MKAHRKGPGRPRCKEDFLRNYLASHQNADPVSNVGNEQGIRCRSRKNYNRYMVPSIFEPFAKPCTTSEPPCRQAPFETARTARLHPRLIPLSQARLYVGDALV